ncbi:peptidase inhibitor family I36 protein [Actinomycetes bacterium KLBMP 9797]
MKRFALVPLTVLALVLSAPTAAAATAGPTTDSAEDPASTAAMVQSQVDAYLAANPGGTQINETEIAYDDGALIVTVTAPVGTLATADCPSGWFCFYESPNFTYPRGRLSDTGWQDLNWWGWRNRTESVHSNTSCTVYFLGETGATDTVLFSVAPGRRTRSDVAPYRNQADYVYRQCA